MTKQKDPKRQQAGRKGHEKYMEKLKEEILSGTKTGTNGTVDSTRTGTNGAADGTRTGTNGTVDGSIHTNFNHMYGVGAVAVLAVAVCIFIFPKLTSNLKKTKAVPQKQETSKIRRSML